MPDVTFLDCTLRDGGYYTNWDFPEEIVTAYLKAMESAKVDAIELGFRYFPQNKFYGPFAYCTDDYLETLDLPKNALAGVMINASDMIKYPDGPAAGVDKLFVKSSESPVDFVRVATHFANIDQLGPIVTRLKELGYFVTVNLMQAGGKSFEQISEAALNIAKSDAVDVLYFADSFGNMSVESIVHTIEAISSSWGTLIGVHTHDNMGTALVNTMKAFDNGATWLDGTIMGIGRGAGNAKTELILLELIQRNIEEYNPDAVFPLVIEYFEKLREKYKWGSNLLYHLSAMYEVHPTYVQEMLSHERYDAHHVISALEYLRDSGAASYSDENFQLAMIGQHKSSDGAWSAKGFAENRNVLVIGSGPGVEKHLSGLVNYVEREKPVVICLNVNNLFPPELVTAYAACHKIRVLMDADKYKSLKRPLIIPIGSLDEPVLKNTKGIEVLDFGMKVNEGVFDVTSTGCTIPYPLVVAYVLAIASAGGAKKALMAGFDGYSHGDPRQNIMGKLLERYEEFAGGAPLVSVTPTTYPMEQTSIYSPDL